jgi:hypothetical protein
VFEMKKNLPMYTGKRTITDEQLQRIATEFQKRQTYFTKQGIKMYIELIPSKFKVYSDKLPTLLQKGDHNMGDRFIEYFQENTTIPVIDGAPVLISKKETEPMFYKYDTHFNSLAAFYVHQKLVERIHQDFPNLPLMDTSNFVIEKVEETGGNMKKAAIDQNDVDVAFDILPRNQTFSKVDGYGHKLDGFRYGNYEYCKRYKSAHNDRPKALVIRDSFANLSLSFFPEIFSEVVFIWDDWHYKFNREIVDIEKPDIIIYSFYEGYIDRLLMEPSFVEADQSNDDVQ